MDIFKKKKQFSQYVSDHPNIYKYIYWGGPETQTTEYDNRHNLPLFQLGKQITIQNLKSVT